MDKNNINKNRREFLKLTGKGITAGSLLFSGIPNLLFLEPAQEIDNPLIYYPNRDWEKIYRDQYRYDESFTWVCSPNCTHECRMKGFIRNGVMIRSEQNYDNHKIKDLYGNQATYHWNPRGCSNGFTFHRRVYGSYRLKYPMVRKGWKQWADDGFPQLTQENKDKYKFSSRGNDEFIRLSWDEIYTYIANGMISIAKRYSGNEGKKLLLEQGYPEEMLEHWKGSGVRTFKLRGGMGLLGVIGKYGMYRLANMLALLDTHIRGIKPEEAVGGRIWSNYTWHGDQAPGFPFVHGLQTSDCDFNDLRYTKLHIQIGKNLVENKRPDSHFFIESMERGAKVIVITPEYSPPATKADLWISIRPQTDAAFLLGVTKVMIDNKWYDEEFVKKFTDLPFLVRTDTLKRLKATEIFPDYKPGLSHDGPSFETQHLTKEQYEKLGDYVIFDETSKELKPLTRDNVGNNLNNSNPSLTYSGKITLIDGQEVEVKTTWELYKIHLQDYDLDTVEEITGVKKEFVEKLAHYIATIKPVAIHIGEGINHWFHATEINRAIYLPLMLTGNIGKPGAGGFTWAGNYKAALFQGSEWSGPGFLGWIAEDPFNPNLETEAPVEKLKVKKYTYDEEPAYWNYDDRPLIVDTPKYGKKCFTGKTHMPTPTKLMWSTNVNIINNAKWVYEMIKNVNPNIELIISQDIEMTSTCEYSDMILPANTWIETETYEITASCSNPFLQIWKGTVAPIYDTKDDAIILAEFAKKLGEILKDTRFENYWKFALEKKTEVYIQRLLDGSTTTKGYKFDDIMIGKYGEPGAALMLFRTYPRVPFYEQVNNNQPFFTPTGRLQSYNDEPEVIEYGENFIVHREGPEATPYLPNVIVSTNPYIRPDDYGIESQDIDVHKRHVRNIKLAWQEVKKTKNPLWEQGFTFYCLTPKTRHATHSSWQVTDWQFIWNNQYGDPYRMDKRMPGVGEAVLHINPQAAKDLGLNEGDYVYVDSNPDDRPYRGAKPDDPFYKISRLMLRVKYNPAYPYNIVMTKHGGFIATERSVKAHETRPDGRALSEGTGYQASFRYGSQQSITRGWLMPMHQLDSLFHKAKVKMGFIFGGEADNHAVNTTPKETLVKITKAEAGGLGGVGVWEVAKSGFSPAEENDLMLSYLNGEIVEVK